VVADFGGGALTSDAGGLLLGATDRAIRLVERFAACFRDARRAEFVEHSVATLVGQRVFGIALGYEDLNDHDELRHDPIMAILSGKLSARRSDCAPAAGKSTLNRLELSREVASRYHKISHDPAQIERLFVDVFLDAHAKAPSRRVGSSTAITTPTATCRSMFSAAVICWRPSSGRPTSTAALGRRRKSRGLSRISAKVGPEPASCYAPIPASPAIA
jgi:hypothetical protein